MPESVSAEKGAEKSVKKKHNQKKMDESSSSSRKSSANETNSVKSTTPKKRSRQNDDKAAEKTTASSKDAAKKKKTAASQAKSPAAAAAKAPVMIPSYLRSRFKDRGSSLRDQPPSRSRMLTFGVGSPGLSTQAHEETSLVVKDDKEKDEKETSNQSAAESSTNKEAIDSPRPLRQRPTGRSRRGDGESSELMDNNVLLFGQWYRKLKLAGPPDLGHLRAFIMDRKAYWGDEIALRVFAEAFKIVLVVVLQAEERLQCVFPPCGGATCLTYMVLTHRGSVPHYRGVTVTGKHVLSMDKENNVDPVGGQYLTTGMVARLLEDCPEGWEDFLTPEAIKFLGTEILAGGGAHSSNGNLDGHAIGNGTDLKQGAAVSKRRLVVRNSNTLKEVKSQSGIQGLREEGHAVEAYVIDGFPSGSHFVERIVCSPVETNPRFSLSKTPGDGDCLFYAMADVANEVRPNGLGLDVVGKGCNSPRGQGHSQETVDALRKMVSQSLTDSELSFFRAANNFFE